MSTTAHIAAAPVRIAMHMLKKSVQALRSNPAVMVGVGIVLLVVALALLAPYLGTVDPEGINPAQRLRWPSGQAWFGTDKLGRDVYSRTVYGARVSLVCGVSVALLSSFIGLAVGVVTGFSRWADAVLMRIMDGLMAIPAILIAIAFMALTKASLTNVVIAITIAEIPRVARLVRSLVLSLMEQAYVEAAVSIGTRPTAIMWRHILPNCLAPLVVQTTYITASAIITEAVLSFVGAGTPMNIPSWGNMMAESRDLVQVTPYILFFPGVVLSITVLGVNLLGDGIRDALAPRKEGVRW